MMRANQEPHPQPLGYIGNARPTALQIAPQSVLVVGAHSAIGRALAHAYRSSGATVWSSTRRQETGDEHTLLLDLAQAAESWQLPAVAPEVTFMCAAATSQSHCESAPEATHHINVTQSVALASQLVRAGSFVVFLSSSLVLDGSTPYCSADHPVNPQTAYGYQKAAAERDLLALGPMVSIVRLSKVVLPGLPLFEGWAADLRAGKVIHPFSDMVLAPLSLAFTVDLLRRVAATRLSGIVQASAASEISYAQAAHIIAHNMGVDTRLIEPVPSPPARDFFTPRHASFDASGLSLLGLSAPSPEAAFAHFATTAQAVGHMDGTKT